MDYNFAICTTLVRGWFSGHYPAVCHRTDTRLRCFHTVCASVSWLKTNTSLRCSVYPQKRGHDARWRLHKVKQVMSSRSRLALSAWLRAARCEQRLNYTGFEMERKQRPFLLQRPLLSVIPWCGQAHRAKRKRRQQVVFLLRKSLLSLEQYRTETRQGQFSCSEYLHVLFYSCLLESTGVWIVMLSWWCYCVTFNLTFLAFFLKQYCW